MLAGEFDHAKALDNAGLVERCVHLLQESDFFVQADREGIDLIGAREAADDGFFFREADREGHAFGSNSGVIKSFFKDRVRIGKIRGGRKAPGAIVEHPHAQAALAGRVAFFEIAVPHEEEIAVLPWVPPGVSVMGAFCF